MQNNAPCGSNDKWFLAGRKCAFMQIRPVKSSHPFYLCITFIIHLKKPWFLSIHTANIKCSDQFARMHWLIDLTLRQALMSYRFFFVFFFTYGPKYHGVNKCIPNRAQWPKVGNGIFLTNIKSEGYQFCLR